MLKVFQFLFILIRNLVNLLKNKGKRKNIQLHSLKGLPSFPFPFSPEYEQTPPN